MEYIIPVLMLFIGINSILKISFWKLWQMIVFACLCAAFVIGTCRFAILQSKTQLTAFLHSNSVMQDAAVLISIEALLCFAFCWAMLQAWFGVGKKRKWLQALHWYPGLLLFPVLFYVQAQLIFANPGTDFTTLSVAFAIALLVGLPLPAYLVKRFYPDKELRLEVHFLVGLFVCITGLITTVNGDVTYAAVKEPLHLRDVLPAAGLFALTFAGGYIGNRLKWTMRQKRKNHPLKITLPWK